MGFILSKYFGKEKAKRLEFMLNTLVFVVTAIDFLDEGQIYMALVLFFLGLINLITFLVVRVHQHLGKVIVSIINIVASLAISYSFFVTGSRFIKYAWLGIALINFVVALIFWRRWKKYREVQK